MLENYNRYKILEEFFDYPTKKFQLRELARNTDVSLPSVKNHIEELVKENFIKKVKTGTYPGYKAKRNEKFKLYKKLDLIRRLHEIGLVKYLKEKLDEPDAIVIFGSAAYGEDIEKSDIDILVVCKQKKIDLTQYQREINRKINLQFMKEEDIKKNKELANNFANGIILSGYLVLK